MIPARNSGRNPELSNRPAFENVAATIRIASFQESRGKPYLLTDTTIGTDALGDGPIVVIGALDNGLITRLMESVRFLASGNGDNASREIVDSAMPFPRSLLTSLHKFDPMKTQDFAIVSRFRDSITGQFFVFAGGLTPPGTRAGSELIADPAYLSSLLKNAPHQWPQINMEAVIESGVTNVETGTPKVVATQFW
jgi:hypothetical protein